MSSSESDGNEEYFSNEEDNPSRVRSAIQDLLAMKPDFKKGKKSKAKSSVEAYRSQIKRCFPPKQRQSERIDNKKDVQNHLQDIQNDLAKLSEKFDTLSKCLIGAFDKIESLETKVESQEVELKNMKTKITRKFQS